MHRFKKHAVWVILIAIIVGVLLMLKSRKVVAAYEEAVPELRQAYGRHAGVALAPLCSSPEKCREVNSSLVAAQTRQDTLKRC